MEQYLPDHVEWFEFAEKTIRRLKTPSCSSSVTSSFSNGPPGMKALQPVGTGGNLDYDAQVEQMMVETPSKVDARASWDKIYGNKQEKAILYHIMVVRLYRQRKMSNVLLFDPQGTGKTLMSQCAAGMAGWTAINVTQEAMMHSYQGQSEK